MRCKVWWGLLINNGFKISPRRLHIVVGVSLFTPFNDLLALLQWLVFGSKIKRVKIDRPPVFILGHWRSGTTLLHELLVTDPQFASPNTFQCFAPSHHLVSERMFVKFGGFLLPKKRPMDNMAAGWELPQEDEFALMNLGVPTPYLRIAFPRTQTKAMDYFTLKDLSKDKLASWSAGLGWFLRTLTVRYPGKTLVLKSPPHTGRLEVLAQMFPGAKFIHLSRDPRKMFLSTVRLWESLDSIQALQVPSSDEKQNEQDMQDYVTDCLKRMYDGFEGQCNAVGEENVYHVRYEDLVDDPQGTLREIYKALQLGDYEAMAPRLAGRLAGHKAYRPNQHQLDAEVEDMIFSQWGEYAARYGYSRDQAI